MQRAVNIIILSKNRACQLDLLLHSMERFFHVSRETTVLIKDDKEFREGYDLLKTIYLDVKLQMEQDFKSDIYNLIQSDCPFTLFLCDDHVFRGHIWEDDILKKLKSDNSILCVSLRLGCNLKRWHEISIGKPQFVEENKWSWQDPDLPWYSWGYPMSLPSHIYRTEDLINYIPNLDFNDPNTLEGAMCKNPIIYKPFMLCYDKGKIAELHINRVQTANLNRCGHENVEKLNEFWLDGNRISLDSLLESLDSKRVQFFNAFLIWEKRPLYTFFQDQKT